MGRVLQYGPGGGVDVLGTLVPPLVSYPPPERCHDLDLPALHAHHTALIMLPETHGHQPNTCMQ